MKGQNNLKEELLIRRLKNGDMNAFDEIYWKYQRAVFQNVLKLTKDSATAEDIVQEVFISLWEKHQSLNIDLSLAGWLFVSSYNRSVNILKKKLRELTTVGNIKIEYSESDSLSEITETQMVLLNEAISMLSPQKRKVFEMCKLQNKTYEEAAVEMKISKNTVKEYLSEAVAFIKGYIQNHPILLLAIFSSL